MVADVGRIATKISDAGGVVRVIYAAVVRKNPRIEAPPVGREPRNPVMVLVLGWYLLLIGATALLVMAMVPGARNEVVVMAEIVATGVGDDEQIVAAWPDHNGEPWETVLTPRRPEEVSEGGTVKIRFDPVAREFAYTYDSRFHESKPTGRSAGVVGAARTVGAGHA
jgi:hypothetical protein